MSIRERIRNFFYRIPPGLQWFVEGIIIVLINIWLYLYHQPLIIKIIVTNLILIYIFLRPSPRKRLRKRLHK